MANNSEVEVYTGNSRIAVSGPAGINYEEFGEQFFSASVRRPTSEGENAMTLVFLRDYDHSKQCPEEELVRDVVKKCGLEGKIVTSNAINASPDYTGVTGVTLISKNVDFSVYSEPLDIELDAE